MLFDEKKRACGVEFTPNPRFHPLPDSSKPRPKQIIKARKLVVVSCGACGTPSVLERSGIGAKDVLERAGVPLVEELPGVGSDYQDHNLIGYTYRTSLSPEETGDALGRRTSFEDVIAQKHPMWTWNYVDLSAKIRPTDAEVAALGKEFQKAWDRDFRDRPNRPIMCMAVLCG